ncbi:MAG: TRAP transporter large permease subunit [Alphaproteobacteria bacterium]|nr:TRAP transporter large permease subunit [Alphaproteobacteria bacterium]
MAINDIIDLLMFAVLCVLLLMGYPVALTLAGTALGFALLGYALGIFDLNFLSALPSRIFATTQNDVLIAVPLFVFMGVMLERSRVAEDLLESMGRLFGRLPGGLGISVFVVGALLAASTGIVGATVVTMGLLSLPTMLRYGYSRRLAAGAIAASGTLGQIIPPSIVLVLLGDTIASAYQQAQLAKGIFAPDTVTVGDLFAGALIPGLVLVGLYIVYQIALAIIAPHTSPALPLPETDKNGRTIARALEALVAPAILIIAVLGSILLGIATPTEAAALGALGATLLAGYRAGPSHSIHKGRAPVLLAGAATLGLIILTRAFDLRLARVNIPLTDGIAVLAALSCCVLLLYGTLISLLRLWRSGVLRAVGDETAQITAMVFMILIGAAVFSIVFRGLGGDDTIHEWLTGLPGGEVGAIAAVMLVMFLLGFFIDFIEIIFIVVPIVSPILLAMGFDPVWLGVMFAMNLQTSFLTPPFGFALFYLRGVAPPEVKTSDIYLGVMPFVLLQLLMLLLLSVWPGLATWLPGVMN